MKALKSIAFLSALCFSALLAAAQNDNSIVTSRALLFADSLNHAFRSNNFQEYIAISYPGVIKYYGGTRDFREYIERTTERNNSTADLNAEKTDLVQLEKNKNEWQCVVQKTQETIIDGRKAWVVSYMIGQSKDEGDTWKYFDVAYNSSENLVYIMPDIFDNLSIPQRQIIFENNQLARKQ
jgi:hypothetical protein